MYYSFFIPRFVRKAETIITVSNFSKKDLIEQYHIDPGKIDVSCNGPLDGLAPLSINKKMEARRIFADGKPYFLYVGAMHPRKNIGNLILAFEIFKTRTGAPHQLVLAGRKAWMQKEVDAIYTQSPFKKDIIFPGFVPDEELFMLYGGAFALVYVSLFEGFGITILEGMKAGIPVITSNTSSMPEWNHSRPSTDPLLRFTTATPHFSSCGRSPIASPPNTAVSRIWESPTKA